MFISNVFNNTAHCNVRSNAFWSFFELFLAFGHGRIAGSNNPEGSRRPVPESAESKRGRRDSTESNTASRNQWPGGGPGSNVLGGCRTPDIGAFASSGYPRTTASDATNTGIALGLGKEAYRVQKAPPEGPLLARAEGLAQAALEVAGHESAEKTRFNRVRRWVLRRNQNMKEVVKCGKHVRAAVRAAVRGLA